MKNLKPVYDAVKAADGKVATIMSEMVSAFEENTEEGKQKAMDLRPTLEEAKKAADAANELYVSMRDASSEEDSPARKFVPVSDKQLGENLKQISREQYEALAHEERHKFFKNGGSIVEETPE